MRSISWLRASLDAWRSRKSAATAAKVVIWRCASAFWRASNLRVDPLADQLQPAARLLARLIERQGAVVAERSPCRVVRVRGVAATQREALMAAIGDPQHEPRH